MKDIDFILAYKDMKSISDICEELKINYSNLVNGRTSAENEKKVVEKIRLECYKIYSLVQMMEDI